MLRCAASPAHSTIDGLELTGGRFTASIRSKSLILSGGRPCLCTSYEIAGPSLSNSYPVLKILRA